MKDHSVRASFNQITDHLYVGSSFCCQTHFSQTLIAEGITSDVSMQLERIDRAEGAETYLWLPVLDGEAPSQDVLQIGSNHIASLVALGKKVYVHCMNGHGRAPTMASAYLASTGMSADEAMNLVMKKRPETHLNARQRAAVEEFAAKI
jgi:protein-tyrosine phosphatase